MTAKSGTSFSVVNNLVMRGGEGRKEDYPTTYLQSVTVKVNSKSTERTYYKLTLTLLLEEEVCSCTILPTSYIIKWGITWSTVTMYKKFKKICLVFTFPHSFRVLLQLLLSFTTLNGKIARHRIPPPTLKLIR